MYIVPTLLGMVFLSTLPVRERRREREQWSSCWEFLSTLPVRGATPRTCLEAVAQCIFLSTRPVRGATQKKVDKVGYKLEFSSTLPVRGATDGKCTSLCTWNFYPRSP